MAWTAPPNSTTTVEHTTEERDSIVKYSTERKMLLNPLKTKAMIFNPLVKYDMVPQISIKEEEYIDVVEEHKILGKII